MKNLFVFVFIKQNQLNELIDKEKNFELNFSFEFETKENQLLKHFDEIERIGRNEENQQKTFLNELQRKFNEIQKKNQTELVQIDENQSNQLKQFYFTKKTLDENVLSVEKIFWEIRTNFQNVEKKRKDQKKILFDEQSRRIRSKFGNRIESIQREFDQVFQKKRSTKMFLFDLDRFLHFI